jgi:hypothetical protein
MRKTTSLKVEETVWQQARFYALGHKITLGELVEKLLIREMKKP